MREKDRERERDRERDEEEDGGNRMCMGMMVVNVKKNQDNIIEEVNERRKQDIKEGGVKGVRERER